MGKIITVPEESNYNYNNNDVGVVSNTSPTSFEVSGVTITEVKAVLGISANNLYSICRSSRINPYALFRPSGAAPYRLGDFAGYHHSAMPCTYFYYKETNYSAIWNYSASIGYYKDIAILLHRGERPPSIGVDYWNSIKVRIHMNDTMNGVAGNYYSAVQAVQKSGYTAFVVRVTSENIDRSGTMSVYAHYVNPFSEDNVAAIEDNSGYSFSFKFDMQANIVNLADLTQTYPEGTRAYYQYMDGSIMGSGAIGLKTDNFSAAKFGIGTSAPFPDSITNNGQTAYFTGIVYTKNGSTYYRHDCRKYTTGDTFTGRDGQTYRVGADLTYLYNIVSVSTRTNWPANQSEL